MASASSIQIPHIAHVLILALGMTKNKYMNKNGERFMFIALPSFELTIG